MVMHLHPKTKTKITQEFTESVNNSKYSRQVRASHSRLWVHRKCAAWFFLRFHLFIFRERGREGEREGEKHWCERSIHCLVASCTHPSWGSNLQPRHVPWPGIEPVTFHFARWCPTHWASPVRATAWYLIWKSNTYWKHLTQREKYLRQFRKENDEQSATLKVVQGPREW